MKIIKRLAERVLRDDFIYLERKVAEKVSELSKEYQKIIEERDKTIVGLRTIIENQKADILKLRKKVKKRPYFKQKNITRRINNDF
ncbi:hypothetical protein [Avibacterium paragallinarum]|uniref:Uncharacterized protein n=2 Tax=Avibacterium paragallinarum TaxID=728 RepID=A0A0F5EXZ1_AVIPA|nr:hypothetical protein [Avibacterium paragallinarum]KKB00817.1 hypothetical protein Z012_10065 [Avibacterium paragallinarum]POY46095.1 hypothetical protein C3364_09315 [Avibacterium paragallinarum]RZN51763.1 hypothetical protein EIG78_12825 [Avibacterium paragallinarum]RZN60586.1 hypothetical protein EIG79_03060 [Avibacterium paragallinarum]RZN74034.1 hypothetical protein EC523_13235 [Avibacterium paragallinarum]